MNPDGDSKQDEKPENDDGQQGDAIPQAPPPDVPVEAPDVSEISSRADLNTLASNAFGSAQNQGLLDIRHQALEKLGEEGLVDNLDHSPEQHFQTLMMIIQETDNMAMIDKAYATALQLKDAKERAQALLAIANEITYFTSK